VACRKAASKWCPWQKATGPDIPLGQSSWPMFFRHSAALSLASLRLCTSPQAYRPGRSTVICTHLHQCGARRSRLRHLLPRFISRQRTMRSGLATVWCAAAPTARHGGHSRLCALCQAYQCAPWQPVDLIPTPGVSLIVRVSGKALCWCKRTCGIPHHAQRLAVSRPVEAAEQQARAARMSRHCTCSRQHSGQRSFRCLGQLMGVTHGLSSLLT